MIISPKNINVNNKIALFKTQRLLLTVNKYLTYNILKFQSLN
jgi:hypothetical protein